MLKEKKIIVVMPAYNAEKTLKKTFDEVPHDIVDEVILVDDCSRDGTARLAKEIGIRHIIRHDMNKGYGGNQKTCYDAALALGADMVIMLHPDYQYPPRLIPVLAELIASGTYPVVLASRILGMGALQGGMPMYKYIANRGLTFIQNLFLRQKLSEYHTGYRAYDARVLKAINYRANSDDFVFDNQMLSQVLMAGFAIGEVSCPTKYFKEASSINLKRSIVYGIGVLWVSLRYFMHKNLGVKWRIYSPNQ